MDRLPWWSRDRDADDGYVIAMVAVLIIPLVGFMALAIDVGAWYSQATRVQRAVDAAALSSVVWMPDVVQAEQVAIETIAKHGVDLTEEIDDPTGPGKIQRWNLTVEKTLNNDYQVRVVLVDNQAPIFFSQPFVDDVSIARQAIAEFVKPVPLGSPGNNLGIQCEPAGTCPPNGDPNSPGYWLRSVGVERPHEHGDYRSVGCVNNAVCNPYDPTDPNTNPGFDEEGYTFAVDVPTKDLTVTVQVYDPGFQSGRGSPLPWDEASVTGDIPTKYTLFEADGSLLTTPLSTVQSGCDTVYGNGDGIDQWVSVCTFTATKADIYPLQIRTSGFAGDNTASDGTNSYSIRAFYGTTPPPVGDTSVQPQVYAMEMMSVASRSDTTTFELARIDAVHKGKTLSLRLFDPGDGSGEITLNVWGPLGTGTGADTRIPDTCRYRSWDPEDNPSASFTTVTGGCEVITRSSSLSPPNPFNDRWLEVQIDLPGNYGCTGDACYWSIDYDAPAGFGEGTTWAVSVLGDPVRIVG